MITTIDRYMWLRIDGESYKVCRGDFVLSAGQERPLTTDNHGDGALGNRAGRYTDPVAGREKPKGEPAIADNHCVIEGSAFNG